MSIVRRNRSEILSIFGASLVDPNRLYYPSSDECAEDRIKERFLTLKDNSETSVTLVDGAFDVPHPNHEHYLRHCRLLGATRLLEMQDAEINTDSLRRAVSSHAVKLVVTLDADEWIDAKKSSDAAKGGVKRPIYPWVARASRLAGYSFDVGYGVKHTVDLITVERDSKHRNTPLETHLELARFLKERKLLDNLVVYGEHDQNIDAAQQCDLSPLVVSDEGTYELNPHTGEPYSSSEIIKRAQGRS